MSQLVFCLCYRTGMTCACVLEPLELELASVASFSLTAALDNYVGPIVCSISGGA